MANGIDVSHHQGTIDWARVAKSGIRYAFVKATEGAGFVDSKFDVNWKGARLNKVVRGAYHFFNPGAAIDKQFDNFSKTVQLEPGDFAPVLDIETDGQNWSVLPENKRLPAVLDLLDRFEKHYGIKPLVYTNKRTIKDIFNDKPGNLTTYPLWVASFKITPPPTLPAGWTAFVHWQHTDKGAVDGISGNVDLNRCDGDPGPVIPGVLTEAIVLEAAAAETFALAARAGVPPPDPIEIFERVWARILADSTSVLADGLSEAAVRIGIEPAGATTLNVLVKGRKAATS